MTDDEQPVGEEMELVWQLQGIGPSASDIIVLVVYIIVLAVIARLLGGDVAAGEEATRRAEEVLGECLSAPEKEQLARDGHLEVPSPHHQGRVYRIPKRRGTVGVYMDGILTERLCVGPVSSMPDGDTVLLHKLMIEGDEESYLRIANRLPPGN